MEGDARRRELLRLIAESHNPISGTKLAQKLHVSRQVIVQDVALLRANILFLQQTVVMSCYKIMPTTLQELLE